MAERLVRTVRSQDVLTLAMEPGYSTAQVVELLRAGLALLQPGQIVLRDGSSLVARVVSSVGSAEIFYCETT